MVKGFDEIYRDEGELVYRFLYSYTRDADLAEELTQETFLRAFKSINKYNGKCKLSVWLCQIAKHVMYQEFEKRKKHNGIKFEDSIEISLCSTEELVVTCENKKEIYKMIQELEGLTKEVVYLRLTGDLNFKEIGEILNKSENWARVTYYRGKSKIMRRLEDGK